MNPFIILIVVALVLFGGSFALFTQNTPSEYQDEIGDDVPNVSVGTTLDMSGQGLVSVAMSVFDRTDVEVLNLSNNALSGALPAEVRRLSRLKILNLSHNNFTGVPAEIGQLSNLEVLDLSYNNLTGLPYELGNLSRLKLLDLTGNDYAEADLEIIRAKLPSSVIIKTN